MSFNQFNLASDINRAIAACGHTNPTPVQAKSIPEILAGNDVVASAQTGTGKTAAFVLPALHRLNETPAAGKHQPRVLILTPTRELATQITTAASLYGKYLRVNIVSLVGGMPYERQIRELQRGAGIIVATPGRLLDHIEQKRVDLSGIEMLVLDEADRMLDMGFIDDVQYIAKLTPQNRQTLLFTATLDKKLVSVVKHLLKNPVRIDLSAEKITVAGIEQEIYKAANLHYKSRLLKHLLADKHIFKAIIFTATKVLAEKIADQLYEWGFEATALHGDLRQNVRNRVVEQTKRGRNQFLVATDVAARGLHIDDLTHVINFDLPRSAEDYVHRIGRTGRAGKTGNAISFILPSEMQQLQRIEKYIGQKIPFVHTVNLNAKGYVAPDADKENERPQRMGSDRKKAFAEELARERPARGGRDRGFSRHGDKNERRFGGNKSNKFDGQKDSGRRFARDENRGERRFERDNNERTEHGNRSERSERTERGSRPERTDFADSKKKSFKGRARKEFGERFANYSNEDSNSAKRSTRSARPERAERSERSEYSNSQPIRSRSTRKTVDTDNSRTYANRKGEAVSVSKRSSSAKKDSSRFSNERGSRTNAHTSSFSKRQKPRKTGS